MTAVATLDRPRGVTQSRVLVSEWIKLRSLRSTWFAFGAAIVISIGLGMLFSGLRGNDFVHHARPGDLFDAARVSLRGAYLAQLAIGVLGVLLISGEYATGMIKASLTAVPRRVPVLVAKAAVFGAVTYVLTTIMCLVAFLGGQAILSTDRLGTSHLGVSLTSPGAVRTILCCGLYLTVVGLLGLGFGFAIRSTGGAIAGLFGLVLVLPLLAQALPQSWQNDIDKYLPLNILNGLINTFHDPDSLSTGAGIAVLIGYLAVVLAAGVVVLQRRDA